MYTSQLERTLFRDHCIFFQLKSYAWPKYIEGRKDQYTLELARWLLSKTEIQIVRILMFTIRALSGYVSLKKALTIDGNATSLKAHDSHSLFNLIS